MMGKILIGYSACPLTRAAFEQEGHDVWTCDLLPARDNSPMHLQCDIWEVLHLKWDMAMLHPMCTFLNNASSWALHDADFERYPGVGYHQRLKPETLVGAARRAAQDIDVENFRRLLELPYPVAIENPAPSAINTRIRPPDQVVHPYMFGDNASKGTGFWLTKGLPLLVPTQYVEPRLCLQANGKTLPRWANQTDSGQERTTPGESRWLERSKTWPGIAAAAGSVWGRHTKQLEQ